MLCVVRELAAVGFFDGAVQLAVGLAWDRFHAAGVVGR